MSLKQADLVVRLDEERRVLQFLVPGRSDLRVFYELSSAEAEDAAESMEQQLGVMLLSFLSATYTSDAFHLDRYRKAAKGMEVGRSRALRSKSTKGDISAMYELAMQAVAHGLRAKSKAKMKKADQLLREAAAAGSVDAANYLADLWPALQQRSEEIFK